MAEAQHPATELAASTVCHSSTAGLAQTCLQNLCVDAITIRRACWQPAAGRFIRNHRTSLQLDTLDSYHAGAPWSSDS
jgi:hypothetical protein